MEFLILGPVEVVEDGRQLPLGQGRERALLAYLLLHANEVVPSDVLVEELWHGEPPATATKSLHVYVSRLRKRLGADVVVTRAPGYVVHAGPNGLDSLRFERLVADARDAEPLDAAARLHDALALWRGPALADFAYEPWAQAEIGRLEEARLAALEDRIDADLDLGRHAALVGELEALVSRHPYRERLCGQLMLALYRSGRQAEALGAYRDCRGVLSEELGLEPGVELRELERRILAQDESLAPPPLDRVESGGAIRKRRRRRWAVVAALVLVLAAGSTVGAVALGRSEPDPVVAPPSSVALVDPHTNRVVEAIRVSDRPTRVVARGRSVWVLHPDISTLTLIDARGREVVRTTGLGGAPSGIAVDGHGVWVTDARSGTVLLLDPDRLRVIGRVRTRTHPVPARDLAGGHISIGLGSVWIASGQGTIVRIDPATRRIVARIRPVDTGESLGGIAFDRDAVWVAGPYQESMVTRIDPRRNAVVARVFVQKFRLNGIALAGGNVWVSDVGSDQLWAIDAFRNQPVGTTKVGGQPLGMVAAAGSIWVANSGDGTLSRVDPVSRRVIATIPVGGSPNGLAANADGVWVTVD